MPNPYIVGTAVIGDRFYGRKELVDKVLTSGRDGFCMMGNRRIGKTSFLRQLEFLVQPADLNFIGVYWDLQGCQGEEDLTEQLKNGTLDAEAQLAEVGIDCDELEDSDDLFSLLSLLKRGVIEANKRVLLLVDEAESLVGMGQADKKLLEQLHTVMQDTAFARTVICAARQLCEVNQIDLGGSRFLDGFEPVLFVSSLSDADADALIAQGLEISKEIATEIKEKTNRHPYLIQSVCSYLYGHEMSLPKAYDSVMQQGMADKAFADDFRYLAPVEKKILLWIYEARNTTFGQIQQRVDLDATTLNRLLATLEACGYIGKAGDRYRMANSFFTHWLQNNEARLRELPSVVSDAAIQSFQF